MMISWFRLLITYSLLLLIITVIAVMVVFTFSRTDSSSNEYSITNTINDIKFNNTVIITDDYNTIIKKNEATEYAKEILITALTTTEHDSIKQYKPIHFYSNDKDITDMLEYHSLIDVKTLAIAIRVMLINNNDTNVHITNMIVKSKEYRDLFLLPVPITLQPYQKIYIVWYISIAGEYILEQGVSQLLQSLAYTETQYQHPILRDVLLLDNYGNPLFVFSTLSFNIINNDDSLELKVILKNNSTKEQTVKAITVRNTDNEYIFIYDLTEELQVPAYSNVTVNVKLT